MINNRIRLLDCTLRDGGYVNDWKFGNDNIISIFERLVDSKVDVIEIGFLDDRRPFDIDRSIMPDTQSVRKIYGELDKKDAEIVGMIDYGTCDISNIEPCSESYLDGIRVIFKKHLMHEAMEYCRQVKALGYKVYSQLVSITSYTDEELMEVSKLVNDVKPYAVSMVDTYGLLHPDDLLHYYSILNKEVDAKVGIGFHAHNNFQLAYANALTFLSAERNHEIVVDGTLYGMGKSAGNAPIELLAMRLNEKYGKDYKINSMMESIDECILDFYSKSPWGYKLFFYLCALNKCHPNYLSLFMDKQNLSVSKINDLLAMIEPEDKKLLFDKLLAEQTYENYINQENSDIESKEHFSREIDNREVLVIGPGKNICLQKDAVNAFIKGKKPYVISINYIPDEIKVDCVFVTNSGRYRDLHQKKEKIIATSNVESRNGKFDYVINRVPLIEQNEKINDNSFLMFIKFMNSIGVKELNCAGFDGYSENEDNYFNPDMEYKFVKNEAAYLNNHVRKALEEYNGKIKINFLTYSAYDEKFDDVRELAF